MPDAVITGATGFVGSHLAGRLVRDGWRVTCPTRRGSAPAGDGFHWVHCDLNTGVDALPARVDAVIHLAAETDPALPISRLVEVNAATTGRMAEYAERAGATSFVYASTGGVYGFTCRPARETDPAHPINAYSRSKLMGEQILAEFAGRLPVQILRLYFPYGEGQLNRLIPGIVHRITKEQPIFLNDEAGHPLVNPIHISDLSEFICRILGRNLTGIYNVAGTEHVTIRDLAEIAADCLGRKVTYEVQNTGCGRRLVGDADRIIEETGYRPVVSLRAGIESLTRYAAAAA